MVCSSLCMKPHNTWGKRHNRTHAIDLVYNNKNDRRSNTQKLYWMANVWHALVFWAFAGNVCLFKFLFMWTYNRCIGINQYIITFLQTVWSASVKLNNHVMYRKTVIHQIPQTGICLRPKLQKNIQANIKDSKRQRCLSLQASRLKGV